MIFNIVGILIGALIAGLAILAFAVVRTVFFS